MFLYNSNTQENFQIKSFEMAVIHCKYVLVSTVERAQKNKTHTKTMVDPKFQERTKT